MSVSFPDVYVMEYVDDCLKDIFKYGDVLKSLFRVKPFDRNSLWEPVMEAESRRFFDYVTDLSRLRSIPQKNWDILPFNGKANRWC